MRKKIITTHIEQSTIFLSMIFLGIITVLFGLYIMEKQVLPYIISSVGFFVFMIQISEIGFKKFTKISKLKKLGTQQYLSIISAIMVLIFAISSLPQVSLATGIVFLDSIIDFMMSFAGGTFVFSGFFIILEAVR